MRKVLISMVAAGALVSSLSALEVYKDGDNSVGVFGTIRGVAGYGYSFDSAATPGSYTRTNINDIIFGLQGNSRIGVNFTYNHFFGAALVGANEKTLLSSTTSDVPGFRQLYAGYDFGSSGKILVGKTETLTSMTFSSDIFSNDNGLNGFGGTSTSTRRIQVQYALPTGFTMAISENDMNANTYLKTYSKSIPRISLAYDYNKKDLAARVAATYAYGNSATAKDVKNVFLITAGVKPTFGKAYLSGMLTYGLNSDLIGESAVANPTMNRGLNNTALLQSMNRSNADSMYYNNNLNIYAAMLEFGYSLTDSLKAIVGLGYQYSSMFSSGEYLKLHSYSAFFQLPYAISKNFSIIPQIGYLGTTHRADSQHTSVHNGTEVTGSYYNAGGIYAIAQAKFTF